MEVTTDSFFDHFNDFEDPRIDRGKQYSMSEILFVTLCGVLNESK